MIISASYNIAVSISPVDPIAVGCTACCYTYQMMHQDFYSYVVHQVRTSGLLEQVAEVNITVRMTAQCMLPLHAGELNQM